MNNSVAPFTLNRERMSGQEFRELILGIAERHKEIDELKVIIFVITMIVLPQYVYRF